MKLLKFAAPLALALSMIAGVSRPAHAQNATSVDMQRLQDSIDDASRDVSALRSRDASLASQLQTELDALHEDAIYYKVKLRRNEAVSRNDYFDLRDKIDALRSRARGTSAPSTPAPAVAPPPAPSSAARPSTPATTGARMDVPVGTELDVRIQQSLGSATNVVEDRFEATTLVDLRDGDRVIIPAGSVMRGIVSSVTKTTRIERKGAMTVAFDQVTIDKRAYPIRATVTQAIESEGIKGETAKIGTGAGVGLILGGILGGFKGAMAGVLIGGGGTMAATEGKDVELPAGTVLRVRLDSGLNLR